MPILYFQISSLQRSANYGLSTIGEDKMQHPGSNTTYINDLYMNIEGNTVEDKLKKIIHTFVVFILFISRKLH